MSNDYIKRANITLEKSETVVLSTTAERINSKNQPIRCPFVATSYRMYILSGSDRDLAIYARINFNDISMIELVDRYRFNISVERKEFRFQDRAAISLFKSIVGHLQSIFTKDQMPVVKYSLDIGKIRMSTHSYSKRVAYQIYLSGEQVPEGLIKQLHSNVNDRLTYIDFGKFKDASYYMEYLVDALEVAPNIVEVNMPKLRKNCWSIVARLLKKNTHITHITLNDEMDETFQLCIDALDENYESKVNEITFIETHLKSKHYKLLLSLCAIKKMYSLNFIEAMTSKTLVKLLPVLTLEEGFKTITHMSFDDMKCFNVKEFFKYATHIKQIRLVNCNTIICDLFDNLPQNIETIEISGGSGEKELSNRIDPPSTLQRLALNDIKWTAESLFKVCQVFFQFDSSLDFNFALCNCDLAEEEWRKFFNELPRITNPSRTITKFFWNDNIVSPQLLNFLANLPNIDYITLNGSVKPENIIPVSEFISKCKSLNSVSISGGKFRLGENCVTLFRQLKPVTNIELLEVVDQNFGANGLKELAGLLTKNKSIKYVSFEHCDVTDKEEWVNFFEALSNRGTPLDFIFPYNELRGLKKEEIANLEDLYLNIKNGTARAGQYEAEIDELMRGINDEEKGAKTFSTEEYMLNDEAPDVPLDWDLRLNPIDLPDIANEVQDILNANSYDAVMYRLLTEV